MLSVPGAKTVRGYSFFGDSFVYVLFEDGTDLYWARSRVLEYLNQVQGRLPPRREGRRSARTPPASAGSTSTRWSTAAGRNDLAQLRALQDWFLKYELKTVPDVAEVASVGGMVKQYQVVLDPRGCKRVRPARDRRWSRRSATPTASSAARSSSCAEAEYMVRVRGYLRTLDDFRAHPAQDDRAAARRSCSATSRASRSGPRCGAASPSSNGEGEVVGGVVVLRSGKNALRDDRGGQGEARGAEAGAAAGVEIVDDLRPLRADRARGREPAPTSCSRSSSSSRWSASRSCCTSVRRSSPSSRCRSACSRRSSSCARRA